MAEALLRLAEMVLVAEALLGLAKVETSGERSRVEGDDGEASAGSAAAAAFSETLLTINSGLSVPVGRERESATTFALPSKYLKSVVYSAIADNW